MTKTKSSNPLAILLGVVIGSSTAWFGSPRQAPAEKPPASLPLRPIGEIVASAKATSSASPTDPAQHAPGAVDGSRSAPEAAPARAPDAAPSETGAGDSAGITEVDRSNMRLNIELDLVRSPHDRPVASQEELLRALRDCDGKLADECERSADAYELGRVVTQSAKDADRFRKVALTLYVRKCEEQDPTACYELARKFMAGDQIQKNPSRARSLMVRVRYLCGFRGAEVCEKLGIKH